MGNTVFITGADRGIGLALCKKFAESGWMVFAGQFMKEWKELDKAKGIFSEKLKIIELDVTNQKSVQQAVEKIKKETNSLDMLINCAGVIADDNREETLKSALDINSIAPLRMTEALLPLMENGQKRLCFISSEVGSITLSHYGYDYSYYCLTKSALNMSVKIMFNHLKQYGYTFRLYHPGYVKSYMNGYKNEKGEYEPEETAEVAYRQFTQNREAENVFVMTDINGELWPF